MSSLVDTASVAAWLVDMRCIRAIAFVVALLLTRLVAWAEESRTDAYGDPLPSHAIARLGTVRFRYPDGARTIAFSPDGKFLASVGRGDTMRIWDVPSGKEVLRTHDEDGDSEELAWSSDGKWIAVEKFRAGIQIREALTAEPVRDLAGGHSACAVAFSADGRGCAAISPPMERAAAPPPRAIEVPIPQAPSG